MQHAGFLALCVLLTVPECTKRCRSTEHRTLHSINARTAFYTMSVGALVKSCAKTLGPECGEVNVIPSGELCEPPTTGVTKVPSDFFPEIVRGGVLVDPNGGACGQKTSMPK